MEAFDYSGTLILTVTCKQILLPCYVTSACRVVVPCKSNKFIKVLERKIKPFLSCYAKQLNSWFVSKH